MSQKHTDLRDEFPSNSPTTKPIISMWSTPPHTNTQTHIYIYPTTKPRNLSG